jgi:hypothetical protein
LAEKQFNTSYSVGEYFIGDMKMKQQNPAIPSETKKASLGFLKKQS